MPTIILCKRANPVCGEILGHPVEHILTSDIIAAHITAAIPAVEHSLCMPLVVIMALPVAVV